ncbi:potassium transporter Kup [Pseudactinotalea sp. HY158]|uniref:potassium transporter Kup n=1 Tax=Pseudactinotalea sp. HY158 TaxID=2654547 RepID=UPI00129C69E9|nr:KUP/HAK/KT family potassium transporter [Pseudactinotalea sp. HY158]QGH70743.1 potassium transporter Kup [Pseudactinotalea sp. HY158]
MSEPPEVASQDRPDRARPTSAEDRATRAGGSRRVLFLLAVLGVVYGDLGTSTIYALRTAFSGRVVTLEATAANVLGILSLVLWTLILVVSIKYMGVILRLDNRGEGGLFALIALLRPWRALGRIRRRALVLLGLAGAAMLYAGVMITPAISILSAVEGLEIAAPGTGRLVVPITIAILVALFLVQRFGTARIGAAFGPVMALWFASIGALGLYGITRAPQVLAAIDPRRAAGFLAQAPVTGLVVLFAVFLVTTGAEALYADLGHFGTRSIRRLWFAFVLPALLLSYLGQGAGLLRDPSSSESPFFRLVPTALLVPMVVLATVATIIASQAAITGAFSLTRAAGRLGMMPPLRVVQTSAESPGQVYVPAINRILMSAAIVLVLTFQTSERLASAYGISVNTTMVVTTVLAFVITRERLGWPRWRAGVVFGAFLVAELAFLGSNLLRVPHGGWFPVLVGAGFFAVLSTWRRGGELLAGRTTADSHPIETVHTRLREEDVARVPGAAVFLTPWLTGTPPSLIHHVQRTRALQRRVVLLGVLVEDVPRTTADERIHVDDLGEGFARVVLHYGYLQRVNVPSELNRCRDRLGIDLDEVTYYIEHEQPLQGHGRRRGLAAWRERLYAVLKRNALDPTTRYQIPSDRIVDLGLRIRI